MSARRPYGHRAAAGLWCTRLHEAIAERVVVVDLVGQVPEVAAAAIGLGSPVVCKFQQRRLFRVRDPPNFLHAELVAVKIQALVVGGEPRPTRVDTTARELRVASLPHLRIV